MKTKPLPALVLASTVAFAPPLAAVAQTDAAAGTVTATTEAGTNSETAQKMATPAPGNASRSRQTGRTRCQATVYADPR